MATDAPSDARAFQQYITSYLDGDNAELSPEDLLKRWRALQETAAVTDDIRQGIQDYENGKAEPISDAFNDVRRRLREQTE